MFAKLFTSQRLGLRVGPAFLLCLLFQSSLGLAQPHGQALASGSDDTTALIGTWRYVRGVYDGRAYDLKGDVVLKHVTGRQVVVLRYKGDTKEVVEAHGGTCSLENGVYVENPTYGFGPVFKDVRDQPQHFQSKLDGDVWRIQVGDGKHAFEEWRRVRE